MSTIGEKLLKIIQHMEAEQHAAEQPTNHRRNKKRNQNMHKSKF